MKIYTFALLSGIHTIYFAFIPYSLVPSQAHSLLFLSHIFSCFQDSSSSPASFMLVLTRARPSQFLYSLFSFPRFYFTLSHGFNLVFVNDSKCTTLLQILWFVFRPVWPIVVYQCGIHFFFLDSPQAFQLNKLFPYLQPVFPLLVSSTTISLFVQVKNQVIIPDSSYSPGLLSKVLLSLHSKSHCHYLSSGQPHLRPGWFLFLFCPCHRLLLQ